VKSKLGIYQEDITWILVVTREMMRVLKSFNIRNQECIKVSTKTGEEPRLGLWKPSLDHISRSEKPVVTDASQTNED
jgi:hypothetical protein